MTAAVLRISRFGVWAIVGALAFLGLIAVGAAIVVPTVLAFVVGGVSAALWIRANAKPERGWMTVPICAAAAAVGVLTLAGLVVFTGAGVLVAAPALAALFILLYRRGTATTSAAAEPATAAALTDLSNAELARRWRSSYADLKRARDAGTLTRVCAERKLQLDEIERRDPTGFGRWIRSGYWVRGDSAPFLGS